MPRMGCLLANFYGEKGTTGLLLWRLYKRPRGTRLSLCHVVSLSTHQHRDGSAFALCSLIRCLQRFAFATYLLIAAYAFGVGRLLWKGR